jgi:hypothetical protein
VILLVMITCEPILADGPKGHSVEFSVGALVDSRVFEPVSMENPAYATASVGYAYQFGRRFSLGAWGGLMRTYQAPPAIGGIKLIFGDKVNGLALSINLGVIASVGVYWKNFFFNGMLGMIETAWEYGPDGYKESVRIRPYIEMGYSIFFGQPRDQPKE